MWDGLYKNTFQTLIVVAFCLLCKGCGAISNANFNAQIREHSVTTDHLNFTNVKTLQKQDLGLSRYASYVPVQNPVIFKDVPDNVLSGSSHGRGLLHHEHIGYGGLDYEDPNYGHGQGYDYQLHDNHDPHEYHHYDFHDAGHHHSPGHHHGYGHHHKLYEHGLAAKAVLWPIAGIALLGAAAALVSNPILLQLGVVSGKRKRRHIEDVEYIAKNSIKKWSHVTADVSNTAERVSDNNSSKVIRRRMLRKNDLKVVKQSDRSGKEIGESAFAAVANDPKRYSEDDDRRFIPIPLKFKKP